MHSFVWFRYNGVEESYKNEEELLEIQLETTGLRTKLYRRSQSKEKKGTRFSSQYIRTTVGRVLLNQIVSESIPKNVALSGVR